MEEGVLVGGEVELLVDLASKVKSGSLKELEVIEESCSSSMTLSRRNKGHVFE